MRRTGHHESVVAGLVVQSLCQVQAYAVLRPHSQQPFLPHLLPLSSAHCRHEMRQFPHDRLLFRGVARLIWSRLQPIGYLFQFLQEAGRLDIVESRQVGVEIEVHRRIVSQGPIIVTQNVCWEDEGVWVFEKKWWWWMKGLRGIR